jgi:glyoxylase-like metal-dependent hydrolase (beta-lactamase superfamily II)
MRVSAHCHAVLGLAYLPPWSVNAGFIVGAHTTLVVDAGPTPLAAATIHGYATAAQPANRMLLVDTERHLDHMIGNAFFHERGVPILGHRGIARTERELLDESAAMNATVPDPERRARREGALLFAGARILNPTQALDADQRLDLGGIEAQLLLTPGHTPTNLAVFVPADATLFCGDTITSGYLPNLEAGGPEDWVVWLRSLDRVAALEPRAVICGHGPVLLGDAVPGALARMREILQTAIREGRAPTAPRTEQGEAAGT